jgi:hypothetical protein
MNFFSFQDTYNSRLKEKYENDLSIHPNIDPDLLLEAGSSGGPGSNQMYELSNIRSRTCGRRFHC